MFLEALLLQHAVIHLKGNYYAIWCCISAVFCFLLWTSSSIYDFERTELWFNFGWVEQSYGKISHRLSSSVILLMYILISVSVCVCVCAGTSKDHRATRLWKCGVPKESADPQWSSERPAAVASWWRLSESTKNNSHYDIVELSAGGFKNTPPVWSIFIPTPWGVLLTQDLTLT